MTLHFLNDVTNEAESTEKSKITSSNRNLKSLFVCFVALLPKSTAMVMGGRSVHLTTLFFLGKLEQAVNQYFVHTFTCN